MTLCQFCFTESSNNAMQNHSFSSVFIGGNKINKTLGDSIKYHMKSH